MSSSPLNHSDPLPLKRKRKRLDPDAGGLAGGSDAGETIEHPVLSHAERRKQKKQKLATKNASEPPSKLPLKRRKPDDAVPTNPRQNSVWVGNLSFKTTAEALKSFFDGVGEITRLNMPLKPGGKEIRGSVRRALRVAC